MGTTCYRKMLLVFVTVVCLFNSGCLGIWQVTKIGARTKVSVSPNPANFPGTFSASCGTVAIRRETVEHVDKEHRNVMSGFVNALEKSGLFEETYYHVLPTGGKTDWVLDPRFKKSLRRHGVGHAMKAVLTGLTFGLAVPVVFYHHDFGLQGEVDVYKDNQKIDTVMATANARWSATLFGLPNTWPEIGDLQESVYRQLLMQLGERCLAYRRD